MESRPGLFAWLMLSPVVVWLLALVVAPTLIMLAISFCQTDEFGQVGRPDNASQAVDNYRRLVSRDELDDPDAIQGPAVLRPLIARRYLWIILRSLWYAGWTTAICVLLGYPIAFVIGRAPDRWRHRLLIAVMVPFWTSFLIRTYAWITLLGEDGPISRGLQRLHLISRPLELLYTPTAVLIGLVYTYLPFMILPIYGSVQKLDGSLLEAASDLGATPLRAFRRVVWPLTWPGVAAGTVLTFVPAIAMYAVNDLLGGGKVEMVGNTIETQFTTSRDWPFGSALGMVVTLLFATTFALFARRSEA